MYKLIPFLLLILIAVSSHAGDLMNLYLQKQEPAYLEWEKGQKEEESRKSTEATEHYKKAVNLYSTSQKERISTQVLEALNKKLIINCEWIDKSTDCKKSLELSYAVMIRVMGAGYVEWYKGEAAMAKGQLTDAQAHYIKMFSLYSKAPDDNIRTELIFSTHKKIGSYCETQGDLGECQRALIEGYSLIKRFWKDKDIEFILPDPLNVIGNFYFKRKNYEFAKRYFTSALSKDDLEKGKCSDHKQTSLQQILNIALLQKDTAAFEKHWAMVPGCSNTGQKLVHDKINNQIILEVIPWVPPKTLDEKTTPYVSPKLITLSTGTELFLKLYDDNLKIEAAQAKLQIDLRAAIAKEAKPDELKYFQELWKKQDASQKENEAEFEKIKKLDSKLSKKLELGRIENLKLIVPGMKKDKIKEILGAPQSDHNEESSYLLVTNNKLDHRLEPGFTLLRFIFDGCDQLREIKTTTVTDGKFGEVVMKSSAYPKCSVPSETEKLPPACRFGKEFDTAAVWYGGNNEAHCINHCQIMSKFEKDDKGLKCWYENRNLPLNPEPKLVNVEPPSSHTSKTYKEVSKTPLSTNEFLVEHTYDSPCGNYMTDFIAKGSVSVGRGPVYGGADTKCKAKGSTLRPDDSSFRAYSCENNDQLKGTVSFAFTCMN